MYKPSFAFLVTLYFVFTHINCDINSSNIHFKSTFSLQQYLVNQTENATLSNIQETSIYEDELKKIQLDETILSNEEKGKLCLKNITECIDKDTEYEETTNKLSNLLFSSLPPFDLSNVPGVSLACQKHSKIYIRDLKKFKMWALKMYDSTAKLPSGILNGNVNQFGDFDMCLEANHPSYNIHGQYCLASMEIQSPSSAYLSGLHRLIQSHYHFRSKLEDPGHRVPRFSSINWALCVPNSCTPKDVEIGLKSAVNSVFQGTELEVRYEVDPNMCQSSIQKPIPLSTYIGISFFGGILIVVLLATLYDIYSFREKKNEWIIAFSLKKNVNSIISMKRSADDIEAVHGIRFLNALMLLFAHKSMALFFLPYANRTELVETTCEFIKIYTYFLLKDTGCVGELSGHKHRIRGKFPYFISGEHKRDRYLARPFSVIGRAASLYTDPFIMISGTLTAYSILGKLQQNKNVSIVQEYVSRLLRIVPTFAALIAFCTLVLPWLNSGPTWNLVVTHHSDICKNNWWRNLLFIHNYFGFKDMCLTHTHHVGIDTQLFFISPLLIFTLWKWPKGGSLVLITFAIISTIMRYYVTYTMRLSNYIHFGTSIQQLFDTADNMYILPVHRATVYIMGIFLGFILRNSKNIELTQAQLRIGTTLALSSFIVAFFVPAFMGSIDYVYDPIDAACYAAFAPIFWCFSFAWVVFTSHIGQTGIIGKFFSRPIFTLWTKISYTVYLTQFPIYFYNVGITRSPENFGFFRMMLNLKEYVWVFALSAVLTLLFELPSQNIRNIIFKKKLTTVQQLQKKIN